MDNFRYVVIGHPLGHSMSPFIHRRLFALQGREEDYGSVDIPPEELDAFTAVPEKLNAGLRTRCR